MAGALTRQTGIDTGGLPLSREWTTPPGVTLDDGLSSSEAVSLALWNNAEYQAALAALGIARADLIDAGVVRNPVLSLLFPWGPKQFEAAITWPIEMLWQRPRRIEVARLHAESVAQQLVTHGLGLVAEVRTAYVEAQATERAVALASEQAQLAAQIRDLAAGRLRAGDISDFEARLSRTEAARLEAVHLTRTAARDLAIVRLRTLLGLAPAAPAIRLTETTFTPVTCPGQTELLEMALAARPDVRAAELLVEEAGARAGLEKSKIYALSVTLDMNGQGREGFEMGPGLVAELPILSQNQGGRARAAAEIEQAGRRYLAIRAAVVADVQAASIRLTEARGAERVLGEAIGESLTTERQQAQRLFEAGEISLLELLETRRRLAEVDMTRLEAGMNAARASVRLEQAIGRRCSN